MHQLTEHIGKGAVVAFGEGFGKGGAADAAADVEMIVVVVLWALKDCSRVLRLLQWVGWAYTMEMSRLWQPKPLLCLSAWCCWVCSWKRPCMGA